jgi:hypothetical protein
MLTSPEWKERNLENLGKKGRMKDEKQKGRFI